MGNKEGLVRIVKLKIESLTDTLEDKVEKVALLNTLGGYFANEALNCPSKTPEDRKVREQLIEQAIDNYNNAGKQAQLVEDEQTGDGTALERHHQAAMAATWAGRGVVSLMQENQERAEQNFQLSTDVHQEMLGESVLAMMGKARIAFHGGDYKAALKLFCDILRLKPDSPASLRVGIALCYYKLGRKDVARKAYLRVQELDPTNVDALMGLAVLELNEGAGAKEDEGAGAKEDEAIRKAMSYTMAAWKVGEAAKETGCTHSTVLNHLANHFFYRQEYAKAEKLAISSFHNTQSEALKAESCYAIARLYHVNGEHDRAKDFYQESVKKAEKAEYSAYVLPHFGLGQLQILKKEYDLAIKSFEAVAKHYPDDFETLKILGWLYATQGRTESGVWSSFTEKAVDRLRRVVAMRGDDLDALLELAQLLEDDPSDATHTKQALEHYRSAIKVMARDKLTVRPEIHSNVGVLYYRIAHLSNSDSPSRKVNNLRKAESSLVRALEFVEEGHGAATTHNAFVDFFATRGEQMTALPVDSVAASVTIAANQVTAAYNLGRVYEAMDRWSSAQFLYGSIVKAFPEYVDAWLRLGAMARDRRDFEAAQEFYDKAVAHSAKPVDAMATIGAMHLKKDNLKDAQHTFEKIVKDKKLDSNDVYSHVALGNIYLRVAADAAKYKSRDENTADKEKKYQKYAMDNFRKAFSLSQNKSTLAANGMGSVMAEQGFVEEATKIFQRVREATDAFADGWINLAHMYVAEKEYFQAIKLYEKCLRKFYDGADVGVLQFIARTQFDWGKQLQEKKDMVGAAEKLRGCQVVVTRAMHLEPQNHILRFNLAVAKLQTATCIAKQLEPKEEHIRRAELDLQLAKAMLTALSESECTEKELGFKKAKAVEHLNACDDKAREVEAAMAAAQERRARRAAENEKRQEAFAKLKAWQAEEAAQKEAQEKAAAAEKKAIVQQLKEKRAKVMESLAAEQQVESEQKQARANKKRKQDSIMDDRFEEEDGDEPSAEGAGDGKRRKAEPNMEDLFGTDSDDDDEAQEAKPSAPSEDDLELEDDDDEGDEATRSKAESGEEEEKEEEQAAAAAAAVGAGAGEAPAVDDTGTAASPTNGTAATAASRLAPRVEKPAGDDDEEDDLDLELEEEDGGGGGGGGGGSAGPAPAAVAMEGSTSGDVSEAAAEGTARPSKKRAVMMSDSEEDD
jgi:RNA polymerase-associated protein CTR9